MTYVIVKSRRVWSRQPQTGTPLRIERNNPNARGLIALLAAPSLSPINAVSGKMFEIGSAFYTNSLVAMRGGLGLRVNGASGGQNRNLILPTSGLSTRSFTLFARLRTTRSDGVGVGARDNGSNILLWRNSGGWGMRIGGLDYTHAGGYALDTVYDYAITSGPTAARLYVNGEVVINGPAAYAGTLSTLIIGNDPQGGGAHDVDIHLLGFYNRELAQREVRSVLATPYQLFRNRPRRAFISLGAGGGSVLDASATGAAQSGGSAALAAQVALAGVGVALAGGSAFAAVAVPLSASGIAVAGGSANGTATVRISAAGLAQAAGAAGLSASILLAAAGAAQAAGNATLAAQLAALASGAAQAGGSAALSGGAPGALSATGAAQTSGQAVLAVTVQLAATGAAQAGGSATGSASAPGQIAASGGAQAAGSATVRVTVQLTAAGFVQAMGAGQFSVQIPLQAVGQAITSGSAVLTAGGLVVSAPVGAVDYRSVRPIAMHSYERPAALGGKRPAALR